MNILGLISQLIGIKTLRLTGPHIPTKTVEGATLAKLESEWNEADVRLIELNCKAMNTLTHLLFLLVNG